MSKTSRRSNGAGQPASDQPRASGSGASSASRSSTSPRGTSRAGRRATPRRRYDEPTFLERFRTPLIAGLVVVALVGVTLFVFTSSASAGYTCSTEFEAPAGATPGPDGRLGAVQPDMGRQHVSLGDEVAYTYCPPASGKHVNRSGFGPLEPDTYGPDDRSDPMGWIHNLEHGGLVVLYSCEQGACEDASLTELRDFYADFPASAVCGIDGGFVGPVIARFEDMPHRYAALVWGRVLYLDEWDPDAVRQFFLTEGERLGEDGSWIAPPEPQCPPPSPTPSPGASGSPAASPSPSAS